MKYVNSSWLYVLLAVLVGGCLPKGPTAPPVKDFSPHQMSNADFKAEIARLSAITEKSKTAPNEKSEAHRRLAIIYLSPGNPGHDHEKALVNLGKYLNLSPEKLDHSSAADWVKALETAREYEQSRNSIARLEKKNRELGKNISELKEQNVRLEKTIEQLKNLDLSLEKKRKNLQ